MTIDHPFLLLAAGATALLALLFLKGWLLGYPAALLPNSVLSAKEQAILKACGDAFLPAGGQPSMSAMEAGVIPYFDRMIRALPALTRLLIRLLIRLMEHGPWIFGFRARLTRQSLADRIRTFEAWSTSRIYLLRLAFMCMRTLLSIAYLARPEVAAQIGASPNATPFESGAPA
jgi:hypothetical protein